MVKGYEFAKGKHVTFTSDELKALEDATSPVLQILQFVPLESVDPMYFQSTYYLLPDKGGGKPYALLAAALGEEARCAVGKWTSRGREHVVIIRPMKEGLVLHQLHFKAEVRELKEFGHDTSKVSDAEIKLARQLISHLAAKRFNPAEFVDEHRARVQTEIKKKVQGKGMAVSAPPVGKRADNVVSLMDALKASLKTRSDSGTARRPVKKPTRKRSAA
jgi:DNA end-binding protein Ku